VYHSTLGWRVIEKKKKIRVWGSVGTDGICGTGHTLLVQKANRKSSILNHQPSSIISTIPNPKTPDSKPLDP